MCNDCMHALYNISLLYNITHTPHSGVNARTHTHTHTRLHFMFVYRGVNVSTYVLPTEAYPVEVRSTFFGLSAAMGKVGALLGTYAFQ